MKIRYLYKFNNSRINNEKTTTCFSLPMIGFGQLSQEIWNQSGLQEINTKDNIRKMVKELISGALKDDKGTLGIYKWPTYMALNDSGRMISFTELIRMV